jgi:hypothetical protein
VVESVEVMVFGSAWKDGLAGSLDLDLLGNERG